MKRNLYTDDEHDAIARYVVDNHRKANIDWEDKNRWRRSPAFHALCNAIPGHSPDSIVMKVHYVADALDVGTSAREWVHEGPWLEASLKRIGQDKPPETAEDIVRRLGGGDLLFGDS